MDDYPIMRERKWISKEEAKEMFPDYHDRTLHMPCEICGNIDVILKKNAKEWICPFCQFTDKNEKCFQENLTTINKMYKKLDDLNSKCEDNMKALNAMMLELKGIISMVRPMAKKNDWYKDEIDVKIDPYALIYQPDGKSKELPIRDSPKD